MEGQNLPVKQKTINFVISIYFPFGHADESCEDELVNELSLPRDFSHASCRRRCTQLDLNRSFLSSCGEGDLLIELSLRPVLITLFALSSIVLDVLPSATAHEFNVSGEGTQTCTLQRDLRNIQYGTVWMDSI